MDIGSIFNNALGGLLGGLALLLLMSLAHKIRSRVMQRRMQPKETLDKSLLESQEYKEILNNRKFQHWLGYGLLFWFLSFLAVFVAVIVSKGTVPLRLDAIGFLILLFCGVLLQFYIGYSPISSQEVELKRQQNRTLAFREAQGAKPYGYIFRQIIFPILSWFYFMACVISLVLLIAFPLPSLHWHIPVFGIVLGIGLIILVGLFGTYFQIRIIDRSIKDLKYVPYQQRQQLRRQFLQDEFERR